MAEMMQDPYILTIQIKRLKVLISQKDRQIANLKVQLHKKGRLTKSGSQLFDLKNQLQSIKSSLKYRKYIQTELQNNKLLNEINRINKPTRPKSKQTSCVSIDDYKTVKTRLKKVNFMTNQTKLAFRQKEESYQVFIQQLALENKLQSNKLNKQHRHRHKLQQELSLISQELTTTMQSLHTSQQHNKELTKEVMKGRDQINILKRMLEAVVAKHAI